MSTNPNELTIENSPLLVIDHQLAIAMITMEISRARDHQSHHNSRGAHSSDPAVTPVLAGHDRSSATEYLRPGQDSRAE